MRTGRTPIPLADHGTVVVIGGGPAGAFFAIQLLRQARARQRLVRVIVIEQRRQATGQSGCGFSAGWRGCSYCAGGLSPRLNDALQSLQLPLPAAVIQNRIRAITIQGYWKNIELDVPAGREMLSVFRGVRPIQRPDRPDNFDAVLLERAVTEGAELISGEVSDARYSARGRPLVGYRADGATAELEADFVVFAAGVNAGAEIRRESPSLLPVLQRLAPAYRPPRLRPALIFELEVPAGLATNLEGHLHFVEYGAPALQLEMCSLLPKRGYITVVLVGASVDASTSPAENRRIVNGFLQLPHIRQLLGPGLQLRLACVCNPRLVIGSARHPFAARVAAIGDMATGRLYKDGILSAYHTASALAETLLVRGLDRRSLRQGYAPSVQRIRRDNRFAALVFLLHRFVFGSSVLSRVFYQAVITERKRHLAGRRRLEKILWNIASGDDQYEAIFLAMIHPTTLWLILGGGLGITGRNYLCERLFHLDWEGFGRFTTGVAKEQLEAKRAVFRRELVETSVAVPERLDFERMYTIRLRATTAAVLRQLGRFGEADRGYLRPRWLQIQRVQGQPNQPGCVVRYEALGRRLTFCLELERIAAGHLVVYRVRDGFARGGVLLFEVEPAAPDLCNLSIYVAFNFVRGRTLITRPLWWLFRHLFPSFVHDVLWNHSLCQIKGLVESEPPPAAAAQPAAQPSNR